MTYKIEFDRNKCRGCGACITCDNWKFDEDGKVSPIKIEIEEIGCNQNVVDICPANAVKITEEGNG